MKQFEYRLVSTSSQNFYSKDEIEEFLNKQGKEGWELTAADYGSFIFKREVKSAETYIHESTVVIDGPADFQILDLKPGEP